MSGFHSYGIKLGGKSTDATGMFSGEHAPAWSGASCLCQRRRLYLLLLLFAFWLLNSTRHPYLRKGILDLSAHLALWPSGRPQLCLYPREATLLESLPFLTLPFFWNFS